MKLKEIVACTLLAGSVTLHIAEKKNAIRCQDRYWKVQESATQTQVRPYRGILLRAITDQNRDGKVDGIIDGFIGYTPLEELPTATRTYYQHIYSCATQGNH